MKRTRHHLYLSTTISRGRLLKEDVPGGPAPTQAPAGADSAAGSANAGNSSDSAPADQTGTNNAGQQFNPDQFWKAPETDAGGNQNQSSDAGTQQGNDVGTQIVNDIKGFKLTQPIFDDAVAQEIADGKLDGINARFQQMGQAVIQQAVVMAARMMKAFEESMEQRIDGKISSTQTADRDEQLLGKSFTAYAKPAMQPVIRGVFQQALIHTKGDRNAAVDMTRGMLKSMGQLGQEDFGINAPPRNPDDIYGSDGAASLVRDLLEAR